VALCIVTENSVVLCQASWHKLGCAESSVAPKKRSVAPVERRRFRASRYPLVATLVTFDRPPRCVCTPVSAGSLIGLGSRPDRNPVAMRRRLAHLPGELLPPTDPAQPPSGVGEPWRCGRHEDPSEARQLEKLVRSRRRSPSGVSARRDANLETSSAIHGHASGCLTVSSVVGKEIEMTWLRDSYTGPGGGLYTGPGGGMYTGPGGGAYSGPGGGMYSGPGGGMFTGPGGGLFTGPGGGLFTGPGGGLFTGPGGGLFTGPGGGLFTGPGGGLFTGPCENPYRSNWPPRRELLKHLKQSGMTAPLEVLATAWRVEGEFLEDRGQR